MLRKEEILSRTSNGLNVFRHYIKTPWRVGRNFLNPLYEDKEASCNIYFDRNSGTYRMKDFGNDDFSGDCFFFVAKLHALDCRNRYDFIETLKIIDRDLSLGLSDYNRIAGYKDKPMTTTQKQALCMKQLKRKYVPIHFKVKFSAEELAFWQKFGVRVDILSLFNVCSVHDFVSENGDGKPYTLYSTKIEPIFGYKSKRYIKLYRPFSKIRFLYGGTIVDNYCFGLEQLPSKGEKFL